MSQNSGRETIVNVAPGFNKNTTDEANEGAWVSGDKVRFRDGRLEKFGGWTYLKDPSANSNAQRVDVGKSTDVTSLVHVAGVSADTQIDGAPRAIKTWSDLDGSKYIAVGTENALEIWDNLKGKVYDSTPITTVVSAANVSTNVGTTIGVCLDNHRLQAGDRVVFNSCSIAGVGATNPITGKYEVLSVTDTKFQVSLDQSFTAAKVTAFGAGSDIALLYHVNRANQTLLGGYGAGTYGTPGANATNGYGFPRTSSGGAERFRLWSLDNFGEDLLAVATSSPLMHWDATNGVSTGDFARRGVRASIIETAPSVASHMFVTEQRHVVMCNTVPPGATSASVDPLSVRWSDRQDYTEWAVSASTEAGHTRLTNGGNRIVGTAKTDQEYLIFTDDAAYTFNYVGHPIWYDPNLVGEKTGLIGKNAVVAVGAIVVWMGHDTFYLYNGATQAMDCKVRKAIFDRKEDTRVDKSKADRIFGGVNEAFHEIIWLYPSVGGSGENDRYVIYNYLEDLWYDGTIVRTSWHEQDVFENPIATGLDSGSNGFFIQHEDGVDDFGNGMSWFATTGWIDIEDGDQTMLVSRMTPSAKAIGNVCFTIRGKKFPHSQAVTTKGPQAFTTATEHLDFRIRARHVQCEFGSSAAGDDFQLGYFKLNPVQDGRR